MDLVVWFVCCRCFGVQVRKRVLFWEVSCTGREEIDPSILQKGQKGRDTSYYLG